MAAPTPSPPPKLDLPGTCRRRRDGTAFPPPLAGFPLPLPHLFSGLAKKLFTNRLVSAIIIPLSQVRAGGSMDRASDSGSEGWGFESLLAYQKSAAPRGGAFLVCRKGLEKGVKKTCRWHVFSPRESPPPNHGFRHPKRTFLAPELPAVGDFVTVLPSETAKMAPQPGSRFLKSVQKRLRAVLRRSQDRKVHNIFLCNAVARQFTLNFPGGKDKDAVGHVYQLRQIR